MGAEDKQAGSAERPVPRGERAASIGCASTLIGFGWLIGTWLCGFDPFLLEVGPWIGFVLLMLLMVPYLLAIRDVRTGQTGRGLAIGLGVVGYMLLSAVTGAAYPGGRHPTWVTIAAGWWLVFALVVIGAASSRLRRPWLALPASLAAAAVCIGAAAVGGTDLPLRTQVRLQEQSMDRQARAPIEAASSTDPRDEVSLGPMGLCHDAFEGHHRLGPFVYEGCPQVRGSGDRLEVWYEDWGGPNWDDPTSYGLLYAPSGPAPGSDDPQLLGDLLCVNHLTGSWWEWYVPRFDRGCWSGLRPLTGGG